MPHLFSRVVGLSDVYDALTSDRSYRRSMRPDVAVAKIIEGSGKDFDPMLTKLFVRAVGVYPVGCPVMLSSSQPAIVCETNPDDPLRPKVKLLRDGEKVIDLRETEVRITKCIEAIPQ